MSHRPTNPIFCAVDTADLDHAGRIARAVSGAVGGLKLGKEFMTANGPAGAAAVVGDGVPLFLDLKFHDIPHTVAGAVRAAAEVLRPFMLTVHSAGGPAMVRAAAAAAAGFGVDRPLILGVTLLTSLDDDDLGRIGIAGSSDDYVRRMATLTRDCGGDGVICSPKEIHDLRQHFGGDFKLVVPGIRLAGAGSDDQKRVMTPADALAAGADYLVIGRAITAAAAPAEVAAAIAADLDAVA